MRALLLSALLSAAPPPSAAQAQKLAEQEQWDELYLAWAAVKPQGYSAPDRRAIALALGKGCDALSGTDAVMAYSLAERAVLFEETVPGLRCLAKTSLATEQRGGAEEALRRGHKRFPKEGAFALELGRLLLEDKDAQGALEVLQRIPPRAPEAEQARELLEKARGASSEEREARSQARAIERRFSGEGDSAGLPPAAPSTSGLSYASGVGEDGMRTRANSRFIVKYFNNARDFSQRAEYEGRIVAALDEAHGHTRQVLGEAREAPVDVVLYTREEFRTHQGAALARTVAGLYSAGAIRINDAAELTRQTKATLVHEYVHAVVDDLVQAARGGQHVPVWLNEGLAEYVEWRYLGHDKPPVQMANRLRGAAQADQLPSLEQMSGQSLISLGDPGLAYATSAMAVRELMADGGPGRLLRLIREVGEGAPFEQALRDRYGRTIPELNEAVKAALSRR
ncbi:peptidase MA family metallohydrolase [Melittangium boletus]|uniref:peptidase MA family metallohydrolase n=1 Tax=Melittangium boletus TaxID=83453 RepID=UPI003DA4A3F9